MIETTASERHDWQQQSHAVLGRLLDRAHDEGLPVIAWTITDAGAGPLIVGNCYAPDPIQRRHDFETWAEILQATAWPNGIQRDGVFRLHAHSNGFDGAVSVSVSAEFATDETS